MLVHRGKKEFWGLRKLRFWGCLKSGILTRRKKEENDGGGE